MHLCIDHHIEVDRSKSSGNDKYNQNLEMHIRQQFVIETGKIYFWNSHIHEHIKLESRRMSAPTLRFREKCDHQRCNGGRVD